jgi:hypothetical protein
MKYTKLVGLIAAPLMVFALSLPARGADSADATTCKDGTTSTASGRGACSGHGGVQKAAKSTAAAAPAAPAAAAPATPAASGTPSTCKDGTTSTATGRGACSGHGGVQKASKSKPVADGTAPAAAPAAAKAAPAAAAAAPAAAKTSTASKSAPTAAAGNTDPTGATAKCKDGTYSKSQHHSGTCSSHGGVAEWLTAQ